MEAKIRLLIIILIYLSILNCVGKNNINAVLGLGMLYWIHLDKMFFQARTYIYWVIGISLIVDIYYIIATVNVVKKSTDPSIQKQYLLFTMGASLTMVQFTLKSMIAIKLWRSNNMGQLARRSKQRLPYN